MPDEIEKDLPEDEMVDDDAELDPDLLLGDDDIVETLDEDEVDPFKDKWEE